MQGLKENDWHTSNQERSACVLVSDVFNYASNDLIGSRVPSLISSPVSVSTTE